jgi:hypothetical protein
VTPRRVLIGALAVAAYVVLFGPWTYVLLTGRPMFVDCGGFEPAACDATWQGAPSFGNEFGGYGPITWVENRASTPTCGDITRGHWWPFYDPLAMTALPLC